jgi:hypothetical protein
VTSADWGSAGKTTSQQQISKAKQRNQRITGPSEFDKIGKAHVAATDDSD